MSPRQTQKLAVGSAVGILMCCFASIQSNANLGAAMNTFCKCNLSL